jgi:hypothetical protein
MAMIKTLSDIEPVRLYLMRIGAQPRSLKTAVVRLDHGKYWKDLAVIRFSKEGEITVSNPAFAPSDEEKAAIQKAWAKVSFPEHIAIKAVRGSDLPPPQCFPKLHRTLADNLNATHQGKWQSLSNMPRLPHTDASFARV